MTRHTSQPPYPNSPATDTVHCHIDNLSRRKRDGGERSAVAAAAYISGSALWNEREQKVSNFGNKNGVVHSEILAPDGAPDWARDRAQLWNAVEADARRKDARLAKTIEAAISRDIPKDQWVPLLREFVAPYVAQGMVADIAIHDDGTNHNPHVHVLLTVRSLKPDGFSSKITNVDQKNFVTKARTGWETTSNKYLAAAGSSLRLDGRSHKARGIQTEPTKHRGPDQTERTMRRTLAREHRQKEPIMRRRATPEERRDYPHLTEREDWPPASERPEADMTGQERDELSRYWDDRRAEARQANDDVVRDRDLGGWLDRTNRDAAEQQAAQESPSLPWYAEAVQRARAEQIPEDIPVQLDDDRSPTLDEELRIRRSEYEQSVWRRAVNMGRSREEQELLAVAKGASPDMRRSIEDHIIDQRMRRIRAQDDADRLAELERRMDPSLREKFETYIRSERDREPDYPQPEPGPYHDAYAPAELDQAREQLREEYERDEDERQH